MSDTIFIVDDDPDVLDSLKSLLESAKYSVRDFNSAKQLLADAALEQASCVIADIRMPDMDGLALQEEIVGRKIGLPVIIVTGHGDVPLAVRAMKAGALDFIEKPFDDEQMLDSVGRAVVQRATARDQASLVKHAASKIAKLTPREKEVLDHLVAGRPNKIIAFELDISPRTVEIHRSHLMDKMDARSLSDLVRMALAVDAIPGTH
jgi:two-component system response regulator FixJ